ACPAAAAPADGPSACNCSAPRAPSACCSPSPPPSNAPDHERSSPMEFPREPRPDLLTFDCYGTLIDWDSALRRYVAGVISAKSRSLPASEFYENWYYRHALPMLRGPFKLYRTLLKDSLHDALRSFGAEVLPADGDDFGDAMADAEPFPDTRAFLHQVAPHFRLGIISNSQDDIISHAVRRMDDLF